MVNTNNHEDYGYHYGFILVICVCTCIDFIAKLTQENHKSELEYEMTRNSLYCFNTLTASELKPH